MVSQSTAFSGACSVIGSLRRIGQILILAFAVIALAAGYWGIAEREDMVRREQNPRLVLAEQRIQRGEIQDRNGNILAHSTIDSTTEFATRNYPIPEAAPVVGYYSLQHGVGGIEALYDSLLRGDEGIDDRAIMLRQLLHQPSIGGAVKLTIDRDIQQGVDHLLQNRRGAIVVVEAPSGNVLALASQPDYDPNLLDTQWETLSRDPAAPLLNRATQGLYQPGSILESILLSAALDSNLDLEEIAWGENLSVLVDGNTLRCAEDSLDPIQTVFEAFKWGCPLPFQALGEALGARRVDGILQSFGLLDRPAFALPTEAAVLNTPPAQDALALTSIGQSMLTVSPLQMAQVAAGFANHGEIPALRLVEETRTANGEWQAVYLDGLPRGTVSRTTADAIRVFMGDAVSSGAASEAALPNTKVYGHTGLALSGPLGAFNAWFIGFAYLPNGNAVVVTVLIEDESEVSEAARIGGETLRLALEFMR